MFTYPILLLINFVLNQHFVVNLHFPVNQLYYFGVHQHLENAYQATRACARVAY